MDMMNCFLVEIENKKKTGNKMKERQVENIYQGQNKQTKKHG